MPFVERADLRWFQFPLLQQPSLVHGVFTRRGGVSPPPWDSLNVGSTVGDQPERVRQNRLRSFVALGCDPQSLFDVWQVHSATVVVADRPRGQAPHQQADAIITASPGVTLFMRFADCVPILFFDPHCPAIGLAHAGWKGTLKGVARQVVRAMGQHFGSRPESLRAAIGPAICAQCYPVGEEVVTMARRELGGLAEQVLLSRNGRLHLDLVGANVALLRAEGVGQIEVAGLCTAEGRADWFSHRAEGGRTGRFAVLLALQSA